jgi:hypothetical protein
MRGVLKRAILPCFSQLLRLTGRIAVPRFATRLSNFCNLSTVGTTITSVRSGTLNATLPPFASVVLVVSCRNKCRSHQKLGKLVEFLDGGIQSLSGRAFSAFCQAHVVVCLASHLCDLCGIFGNFAAADVLADNPTVFAMALPVVFVFLIPAHFVLHLRPCPASKLIRFSPVPLPVALPLSPATQQGKH